MAGKKSTSKKHYPVVLKGKLGLNAVATGTKFEIAFEQLLSKVNRRLYRHGRTYDVKLDIDPDATATYRVFALADNWMNVKAFQMAYAMYLQNGEDERVRLKESNVARWEDFRTISGAGFDIVDPAQWSQSFAAGTPLSNGEFSNTLVVDAAGVGKNFSWGSASSTRYSLLEEYDKAGNAQPSPQTSTGDMPYDELMADDDQVMAEALQTRGNLPPYDADNVGEAYPWVQVATLKTGTTQKLSTGFFKAPCGFVIITNAVGQPLTAQDLGFVQWQVRSGDYKGVHAPSMLE